MLDTSTGAWWRIAGGASMNLAFGSLYAWSVFVAPLEQRFGWKRADTSLVFTISVLVTGLSFLIAGWINDRWGPRPSALAGAVLFSLGMWLSAYTSTLTHLYVCFGVIGGMGGGLGSAVIIPTVAKWFPNKRGLAIGIIIGAYGAGSAAIGPLADVYLIPTFGLSGTFKILGAVFLVMALAGALVMRNPPSIAEPLPTPHVDRPAVSSGHLDLTPGQVLKTSTFWLMWCAYALGCSAGLLVISQLVPFARSNGLSGGASGTLTLVLGAAGNTGGRILSGWTSDAVGRIAVLRLAVGISALAIPALALTSGQTVILYLLVFIIYWCYGTLLSVNAAACADFWGLRHAGKNYGMLFTAWGIAGVIGPRIGGVLFDRYHDYGSAFYSAGLLAAAAFMIQIVALRRSVVTSLSATARA